MGEWDCYQGNGISLTEIWKPKPSWRWEIWVSSPRKHLKTRCNLAATKTLLTLNSLPFVNPSFIFFIYFLITLFFGYMDSKEIAMNPPERQHPKGTQRCIFGFRTITLPYSGEESPSCARSYTRETLSLNEIQSTGPRPEVLPRLELSPQPSTVQMCHWLLGEGL